MDFKRNKFDVPATVLTIEYDPNRTCRIALIEYKDGEKSYILAPNGLQVGMKVESGQKVGSQGRQCHAFEERSPGYLRSQH